MSHPMMAASQEPNPAGLMFMGNRSAGWMNWFSQGLSEVFVENGHVIVEKGEGVPHLVVQFVDANRPKPFRRGAQGTFVVSVVEVNEEPVDILKAAYPLLIRSLSNLLVYTVAEADRAIRTYFVTLEQGYYAVHPGEGSQSEYFRNVYAKMAPLANSRLVVNNIFESNLDEHFCNGNENTAALRVAGQQLNRMNLLPAPFPIEELLPPSELVHVGRLFGIGGLSYGNLSVREDQSRFWMSARGVDKGNMQQIGRDMLLVTGYDPERCAMRLSIPPGVDPRRASVDAIEHWMLYTEHPQVGAIIHVHAWMEGIPSTRVNYPCGTAELAREVAELVRQQPDPSQAVIGLKNHGLTITGRSLADIFERISGRLLPQVPMS